MTFDKPAIKTKILGLTTVIGFFLFGCGKPVQEGSEETVTRAPALSSSTEYIYNTPDKEEYVFEKMGKVYIPGKIKILAGEETGDAELHFFSGSSNYSFFCLYKYIEQEPKAPVYDFSNCYDSERVEGDLILQTPEDSIRIEAPNKVKVDLEIDWH